MESTTSGSSFVPELLSGEVDEGSSQSGEIGFVALVGGDLDGGQLLGGARVWDGHPNPAATSNPWRICSGWWAWVGQLFDDREAKAGGIDRDVG